MKNGILLVEDETIIRLDVKQMLESAGYEVYDTSNGESAIELAYKVKPDLIVMDIMMPKLNGLKASRIIGKATGTPVIFLTAYSQPDLIEDAKQPHVLGYIVKPITEASLIPAVEIALSQVNIRKQITNELKDIQEKLKTRKLIERAKGCLMRVKSLSEDEAYVLLRKMSMNNQKPLEVIAAAVLKKYQLKTSK
ncbi:ANTAR domain-containing response regulator [Siminovitchia fortis]|uniref:Response regulator n=1 Tax=Siminovitchia fortis TaxID=254758 RepID=A0A443IZI2_9BACI|nr:response regulator [Siminovitchia fortis]RWR13529.1 response regulator [Siminovitchia fortis]WHY81772.1 response regulator [Siminovitchia fortis]